MSAVMANFVESELREDCGEQEIQRWVGRRGSVNAMLMEDLGEASTTIRSLVDDDFWQLNALEVSWPWSQ